MGFYDKHNIAAGKDPDSGAIFMTSSGTIRECFRRRLFGLPANEIQFVEKIKAGMHLFLFEYEKRQLHGVFQAASDGAINIQPDAFTSSGRHYPAQVKFIAIFFCKPLSEDEFRNAIRENYFSSKKFKYGLSENQVFELLNLFRTRKLDPDVLGRHMTRMEDFKSEWYPIGQVGRYLVPGTGMVGECVQNEQVVGDNSSHFLVHKYKGDYLQYGGEIGYTGLNADDMGLNKQGRLADIELDTTGQYVTDYLPLKDERRFTAHEDEHYIDHHAARLSGDTMSGHVSDYLASKDEIRLAAFENNDHTNMCPRPYINDGYSKVPSDEIRYHIDGRSSISDRLMAEDLRKTDQRMVFSDDIPGLGDSNVNLPVFYRNPSLERNLAQNHLSPTSAMSHPFQTQITKTSCAIRDADAPGFNFRQLPVGVNDSFESIIESTSLSTHCRRGGGFPNAVMYDSNTDYTPFNEARNSDQLGPESVLYEAGNFIPSLKSSSAPILSDIGNSCREHETLSSFFHNCKSCLVNNVHPMKFRENLSHEITLQNTFNPDVPLANESHSQVQYDDNSFGHGYDIGCYGYSRDCNCSSHPKKKSSVFSRLSLMQDVDKQKNGNNAQSEEYDYHTAVAEVMNMASRSHSQWMKKRKPKPSQRNKAESLKDENRPSQRIKADSLKDETLKPSQRNKTESLKDETWKPSQHNKAESLKDETPRPSQRNKAESLREEKSSSSQRNKAKSLKDKAQIISSRVKGEYFEKALEVQSMDPATASGGNSNTTAEEMCFVDFKRRSKLRKHCDEFERKSNENKKGDNLVLVQQKRRKLIRPNFNNSTSLDDKRVNLGASLNFQVPLSDGSNNLKDVSGNCSNLDQTKSIIKTDAEVQNIIGPTQSKGKTRSHAIRYICDEGGEKVNNGALTPLKDVPECMVKRKLIRPNFNNSTSLDDKRINLGASLNLKVSLSDGRNNLKDVSGSCCTLDQTKSIIKTDAGVLNIIGSTQSEGKTSSHAIRYICDEGGEKANNGALTPLKDVPECMEKRKLIRPNFNNSTSLDDKRINLGASLNFQVPLSDGRNNLKDVIGSCCTLDQTKSIIKTDAGVLNIIGPTQSEGKTSSHAIGYICDEAGEKTNNGALTALKNVPECMEKRKLIRPNFNNSIAFDDKGINLGASQNLQVPLSDGRNNPKDVSGSCCTLDQTESIIKTDAEVQNTTGPTHSEGKNSSHAMGLIKKSSHAMGYICDEGGEKANNEALPALKDVPECMKNINHHHILFLTCKKESGHTKEGSIVSDDIKSVSLEMEPLHSTCQEHGADKIICVDRGINTDGMPKDCGSAVSVEVKESQYLENFGNEKASVETSCDIKEGLCVMHSVESASLATKSVYSTCEEHHLDKIICAGRGIGTEKVMSKNDNVSSTTKVKDGSESLKYNGNDNAPIATCEKKMA